MRSSARPSAGGVFAQGLAVCGALCTVAWTLSTLGCGGGPSEEDIHRSETEYQLSVGLMGEQNFAGMYEHLDESIRLDPDNAPAHLLLGNLRLFRGDYPGAEVELLEAIAANARLERSGYPSLTSDAQNSLGVVYIHTNRLDQAVDVLTESSHDLMNTTPHLALGNLGWANLERGDLEAAMTALTGAVHNQPQFCVGWYRLGQVYTRTAEAPDADAAASSSAFARAEDALTRALEVDAEVCQAFQDAWLLRGEVRTHLGRTEDAVDDFERCVELDATSDAGHRCATALDATPHGEGEGAAAPEASEGET